MPQAQASRSVTGGIGGDRPEMGAGRLRPGRTARQSAQGWYASTHPLTGRELRELRQHKRYSPPSSRFAFVSERGAPLSAEGFNRMVKRAGAAAELGIKVHAHMLRHACGFKLANDGIDTRSLQAYLGHSNIQNTTRYTALASGSVGEYLGEGMNDGARKRCQSFAAELTTSASTAPRGTASTTSP